MSLSYMTIKRRYNVPTEVANEEKTFSNKTVSRRL